MAYNITINGIDRTADVLHPTVVVEDEINDKQNTCSLSIVDLSGNGIPQTGQEIIITLASGDKLFGGYIITSQLSTRSTGVPMAALSCVDYAWLLDRNLAHVTYQAQTDVQIINDVITRYCAGFGITTTNVVAGVTVDQIQFNYVQPSQAFRRLTDLTGRNWYIDYDKDIHYFPLTQNPAPFNIDDAPSTYYDYSDLAIAKDASQLKNRVYVRGGTKLSDTTTYSEKGDGEKTKFVLPDKPHDVSVTVNGVAKSLGIKNVNTTGYDWYLNFQEKYLEQDSGGAILSSTDVIEVMHKYDIPILVAIEDSTSIIANGVREFAIFDKTISTTQAARDRASAELTDYANNLIEGSFTTHTAGFRSGQYINIDLNAYDIDDDYIVQKVTAQSLGGGEYVYKVAIASSKTLGIIRFLIELLEADKNLIELDDDEVIDELLSCQDSLLADSLTELLTIDSAGPYATWCTDSLQSTPTTRARFDLFQWG